MEPGNILLLSVYYNRTSTVIAIEDCTFATLNHETFSKILQGYYNEK